MKKIYKINIEHGNSYSPLDGTVLGLSDVSQVIWWTKYINGIPL